MKLEDILKDETWTKSPGFVDLSEGSERPWYVYRHTCKVNGKCYVGISCNPVNRWRQHRLVSRSETLPGCDTKFKRAIRKHGEACWIREILAATKDQEQACKIEQIEIATADAYSCGYNSTYGGEGAKVGELLTCEFILCRISEHVNRNGSFPCVMSGDVLGGFPGDTWSGYNMALTAGRRGLPGGSSLAKLMSEAVPGYCNPANKSDISHQFIVDRAREHMHIHHRWPSAHSGIVCGGNPGDTWLAYDTCLTRGLRGLPGGSSLAKLLSESEIGYINRKGKPKLTVDFIQDRVRDHLIKNGTLPRSSSGPVAGGYPGDTWLGYERALINGNRGLPGGSSLSRVMEQSGVGYVNRLNKPDLTESFIISRAIEHTRSTGRLPTRKSGDVLGGHGGDTWMAYEQALDKGARGLPGGSSLAKLLKPLKLVKPTQT
jgi:hypothetical protein